MAPEGGEAVAAALLRAGADAAEAHTVGMGASAAGGAALVCVCVCGRRVFTLWRCEPGVLEREAALVAAAALAATWRARLSIACERRLFTAAGVSRRRQWR